MKQGESLESLAKKIPKDLQQLLNKDFNDWSLSGRTPDNYEVMSLGGSVERSTDKHAGTYAAELTISGLYSAGVYIFTFDV